MNDVDDRSRFGERVLAHRRLGIESTDAERNHGHMVEFRKAIEDPGEGFVEDDTVVDPGTHHDLAVHHDSGVEQSAQPPQAHTAPAIAQHVGSSIGIGRVDAHVERRQTFGHDALEVGLGEPRESREVPVQEAQPIVVVLEVQALAHSGWELVDEAERAVVVARANTVEDRTRHLGAEWLPFDLVDQHREFDTLTRHVELDLGGIGE